jgi:dihydropteroate synthase
MRIIGFSGGADAERIMRDIGVDPYGIRLMLRKTGIFLVYIDSVPSVSANILKQEMLALGGDAAVSRNALTGKTKNTGCLIIGRPEQISSLAGKLKAQPFGLRGLSCDIEANIKKYQAKGFVLRLKKRPLSLGAKPRIMGIINLTPDSFSGDGLYGSRVKDHPSLALEKAEGMLADGADIIDLGGESTRPGSKGISAKEEIRRIIPALKKLAKNISAPISVDTTKPEVAEAAIDCGAQIINDISGLRDRRMPGVAAKGKAAVVIMHMAGNPSNMQNKTVYKSLISDISGYLRKKIDLAESSGITPDRIIIDPGLGFAKDARQNLRIINRLADFKILGKPILVGPCRKAFVGKVLKTGPQERIMGSAVSCVNAVNNGAHIVRVHDVKEIKQALKMNTAIKGERDV